LIERLARKNEGNDGDHEREKVERRIEHQTSEKLPKKLPT
jgi:hypothetical protein